MTSHGIAQTSHPIARSGQRPWRISVLASIPVGLVMGSLMAAAASEWRVTLGVHPLDPGPPSALFLSTLVASLLLFSGLVLLVMRNAATGAWLFVLGVALSCGVAVGFFIGA